MFSTSYSLRNECVFHSVYYSLEIRMCFPLCLCIHYEIKVFSPEFPLFPNPPPTYLSETHHHPKPATPFCDHLTTPFDLTTAPRHPTPFNPFKKLRNLTRTHKGPRCQQLAQQLANPPGGGAPPKVTEEERILTPNLPPHHFGAHCRVMTRCHQLANHPGGGAPPKVTSRGFTETGHNFCD